MRKKHPEKKMYPRVYETHRYIVFQNNKDQPFDGLDEFALIEYDKLLDGSFAAGNYAPDGAITGEVIIGNGGPIEAADPKAFIKEANSMIRLMLK